MKCLGGVGSDLNTLFSTFDFNFVRLIKKKRTFMVCESKGFKESDSFYDI